MATQYVKVSSTQESHCMCLLSFINKLVSCQTHIHVVFLVLNYISVFACCFAIITSLHLIQRFGLMNKSEATVPPCDNTTHSEQRFQLLEILHHFSLTETFKIIPHSKFKVTICSQTAIFNLLQLSICAGPTAHIRLFI